MPSLSTSTTLQLLPSMDYSSEFSFNHFFALVSHSTFYITPIQTYPVHYSVAFCVFSFPTLLGETITQKLEQPQGFLCSKSRSSSTILNSPLM